MKNLITTTILFVIAMAGYSQGVNVHTHFQDEIFNVKFSKAAGLDSILRKFAPQYYQALRLLFIPKVKECGQVPPDMQM